MQLDGAAESLRTAGCLRGRYVRDERTRSRRYGRLVVQVVIVIRIGDRSEVGGLDRALRPGQRGTHSARQVVGRDASARLLVGAVRQPQRALHGCGEVGLGDAPAGFLVGGVSPSQGCLGTCGHIARRDAVGGFLVGGVALRRSLADGHEVGNHRLLAVERGLQVVLVRQQSADHSPLGGRYGTVVLLGGVHLVNGVQEALAHVLRADKLIGIVGYAGGYRSLQVVKVCHISKSRILSCLAFSISIPGRRCPRRGRRHPPPSRGRSSCRSARTARWPER